jgi:hypothetical protein
MAATFEIVKAQLGLDQNELTDSIDRLHLDLRLTNEED